jgi:ribosome-associated protein
MDIRKLQRAIVDGLEDVKGQDIQVFNTEHLSPLFERVIIASGQSNRQTKALASSVRDAVKAKGMSILRVEGEENGEWIIVDCGAAVAHIMQPSIRDYYRLEEIWGGKPVKIKLGEVKGGLVKASEGFDDDEEDEPPKKAKAAPAKKAVAAKQPAKAPAKKATSARAASASKPAGSQKGVAKPAPRSAAGKLAAAKKTRAGSTAARAGTAPAKTASVKKVVVPANSSRNAATAAKKAAPAKKTARPAAKAAPAKKTQARRG